jgi:hypothetical protein
MRQAFSFTENSAVKPFSLSAVVASERVVLVLMRPDMVVGVVVYVGWFKAPSYEQVSGQAEFFYGLLG